MTTLTTGGHGSRNWRTCMGEARTTKLTSVYCFTTTSTTTTRKAIALEGEGRHKRNPTMKKKGVKKGQEAGRTVWKWQPF